ncbi:MAG: geranylgeranyl reductase family protein [Chloroflexi bacterium]|nr:geranylgeranyl reductase family protein [Chloroflexota bacterium]
MVRIDPTICCACGGCVSLCPVGALFLAETRLEVRSACTDCGRCVEVCPTGALSLETPGKGISSAAPERDSYDVVVVGGGPAGAVAAAEAARLGLSTLLVEKRQDIGAPVRCAEGVSAAGLLPFVQPDPHWIAAQVHRAEIIARQGKHETLRHYQGGQGYILERKVFDRALAEEAARAGASVRVKTAASGVVLQGGRVVGLRLRQGQRELEVACRLVIAADGVESQVGAWAGLPTLLPPQDAMSCAQYLLAGVDTDPACCRYWVSEALAPGGYVWVFPKGEGRANVGLGVQADLAPEPALALLNRFVENEKGLSGGHPVALMSGVVPVALPLPRLVADGLMVVGDAARQVDPLSGGGIVNAMEAAWMAAQTAARALEGGVASAAQLRPYEESWRASTGRRIEKSYRLRERFAPGQRTSPGFLRVFAVAVAG